MGHPLFFSVGLPLAYRTPEMIPRRPGLAYLFFEKKERRLFPLWSSYRLGVREPLSFPPLN